MSTPLHCCKKVCNNIGLFEIAVLVFLTSDVLGAPKPEGDVPESLIPEPDPTPKSRPRTNPEVSQS